MQDAFKIDDEIIAEMLGRQNFSTTESAILELIKNSYDSGATNCNVIFVDNRIIIEDNGIGMDYEDIKNRWMYVGRSQKKYREHERILSGSKGVGRFALARLGNVITMYSKKGEEVPEVIWKTDWNVNEYETIEDTTEVGKQGTRIVIQELRDNWSKKKQSNLIDYINRMYFDQEMDIRIVSEVINLENRNFLTNEELIKNSRYKICMEYEEKNKQLNISIRNNEFKDDVTKIVQDINIKEYNEIISFENSEIEDPGDFYVELYFNITSNNEETKKWHYRDNQITRKQVFDKGVVLYRNAFSINGFEGVSDWLKLDTRARKSPAAASHLTGGWRVRSNQLCGFISIDKIKNANLRDLANRQGLEENNALNGLRDIFYEGIKSFEVYRQSIIRKIRIEREKQELDLEELENIKARKKLVNKIIKNPSSLKKMTDSEAKLAVDEIIGLEKENRNQKEKIKLISKDYKYEVRVLSSLATQGLYVIRAAHNLKNDRSNLKGAITIIIERLKELEVWDTLSENVGDLEIDNVPATLSNIEDINQRLTKFITNILSRAQRKNFIKNNINLSTEVSEIAEKWMQDFAWLNINVVSDEMIENGELPISKDTIETIFDNLIMNSEDQNSTANRLNISIKIELFNSNEVRIVYKDDGKGLDLKYKNNPYKILDVQETTRPDGHGLGMWIVSDTITNVLGGEIINISGPGTEGFEIEFFLVGSTING